MRRIVQSRKLQNVRYDVRGPILVEAQRLEAEGHKILKLNIGNPAPSARSTEMWCIERISGPEIGWSNVSRLAMKRISRPDGWAAYPPKMKSR